MKFLKALAAIGFTSILAACGSADSDRTERTNHSRGTPYSAGESSPMESIQIAPPGHGNSFPITLGRGTVNFQNIEHNPTCKVSSKLSILDLDGDGEINHFTDGAILLALMHGKSQKDAKLFAQRGARTDIYLYYEKILRPLLDVTGDGEVNPFSDGVLISAYMNYETMTSNQRNELVQKFGGDEHALNELMDSTVDCSFSTAFELDNVLGLVKKNHFYENWGGVGNLWVWSTVHRAWLFVDKNAHVRLWDRKSGSPSTGQSIGRIDSYYRNHIEQFVNLVETSK